MILYISFLIIAVAGIIDATIRRDWIVLLWIGSSIMWRLAAWIRRRNE